jgi:hypothetical protein
MKVLKTLLLLAAIVAANFLNAQNWSLIKPNLKYNYNLDVIGEIENSIFADSFQVNGTDTTFFLNRIITACDTCTTPGIDYYLKNQPHFLQRQVTVSDGIYTFSDPWSFTIQPHAQLNDSWQFDTVFNYTATITDYGNSVTFGETDSIKTISLTNGDIIVVSKKFGIVQFPQITGNKIFTLKGLQGPNVGILVPPFYKFFNFNVGDVFQYEIKEGVFFPGVVIDNQLKKVSILAKSYNQGVFSYQAQIQSKSWTDNFKATNTEFIFENYIDTITFIDSTNHICNAYNHKAVANFNLIDPAQQPDSIMFGWVNCYTDFDGFWIKGLEFSNTSGASKQIFYSSQYDDPSLPSDLLTPAAYENFRYLFKAGLGELSFSWVLPDSEYSRNLIGYVKDGDTLGTVYNDFTYLAMNEIEDKRTGVSLFPNPISESAHINLNNQSLYIDEIRLYDLQGQMIRVEENINSNSHLLERKELPAGCYFMQIHDNSGKIYRQKLIISD